MKKHNQVFVVVFFALLSFQKSFSQDIHFSQFFMAPLNQNPALAGALWDDEAILNYKEQWRSISEPFKTIGATYDTRINKKHITNYILGGGVNFFSDKAGDSQMGTTLGTLSFAYHRYLSAYSTLGNWCVRRLWPAQYPLRCIAVGQPI
jgi:type IX secretion system PorP/SprF family membrane protein